MTARGTPVLESLAAFDGVHVAPLKALVQAKLTPETLSALLDATPGPYEVAATWCLKALADTGRLPVPAFETLFGRLSNLTEPDAILHVLQCAQHAPPPVARRLRPGLTPLYRYKRGLVRVWAFDAYCRGADLPREHGDLAARIAQGSQDRAKAMQARARNLAREFGVDLDPKP